MQWNSEELTAKAQKDWMTMWTLRLAMLSQELQWKDLIQKEIAEEEV